MRRSTFATLFIHLRLHFQLLLAPIFLWGWLLGGGGWRWQVIVAFVAFHVFLYGGTTAFNSYYDRDEGPVGGLERPPSVVPALLPFSLFMKLAGWALALLVNLPFFVTYAGFLILSLAYSHPRVRLKAHPVRSLLVVGFGQGVLAFVGGLVAGGGTTTMLLSADGVIGALAATMIVLGLYPLTQIYQIDEDRERGDRTIAVAWGVSNCFRMALCCQALGGLGMIVLLYRRYGMVEMTILALAIAAQLLLLVRWRVTFDQREIIKNYRYVMRLNTATSSAFALYLSYHLIIG